MNNILFFAHLRERLGRDQTAVNAEGLTIEQLKQLLVAQNPQWQHWLMADELLVAVNQTMVTGPVILAADDEVAMFPPVTGG